MATLSVLHTCSTQALAMDKDDYDLPAITSKPTTTAKYWCQITFLEYLDIPCMVEHLFHTTTLE